MNLDFYADSADKIELLNFIFNETALLVFDHYSAYDEQVRQYHSVEEITSKFDLQNGAASIASFALWSETFKAKPIFSKIILDPKRIKGHTFRYSTEGWGLIRLYFGGLQNNNLRHSHIGHFNEKGAQKNEATNRGIGKVNDWDWKEVNSSSSKLKYYISKKLAVDKIGSSLVLPGAENLRKNGAHFR